MTSEDAWETFRESRAFAKAVSVQGQLDTMASQLNDIQTDTKRIADVIGQIQGDNAAIDYANDNPGEMQAPAPDMGQPMPEDVPGPTGVPDAPMPGEGGAGAMPFADGSATGVGPSDVPDVPGVPSSEEPVPYGGMESSVPGMGEPAGAFTPPNVPVPDPVELDLIAKVKYLISNSEDPGQMRSLIDQLVTALSQGRPAAPMEPNPIERPHSLASEMAKSADAPSVPDAPPVADVPMEKSDDGIATSKDSEMALEKVTSPSTMQEAPKPLDAVGKSEDAEPEGVPDEAPEEVMEIEAEVVPDAPSEAEGKAQEIAEAVGEAVKEAVAEALDETVDEGPDDAPDGSDPFEECGSKDDGSPIAKAFPSIRDMMGARAGAMPAQEPAPELAPAPTPTPEAQPDAPAPAPEDTREKALEAEVGRLMSEYTPQEIAEAMGISSEPAKKDDAPEGPKDDGKVAKSAQLRPISDMMGFVKADRPSDAVMTNSSGTIPSAVPNGGSMPSIRDMMSRGARAP